MSSTQVFKKLKMSIKGFNKLDEDLKDEETGEKLPYILDYLTPSMMAEARNQLNETDEIRAKALDDLRILILKEKNLVVPMDEKFLLPYLRTRKFNTKRAFKLLQNYWLFRREHRSIFDSSVNEDTIKKVKQLLLRNFVGFLPYRDRNGSTIMLFKIGLWNPEIDPYEEIFRAISAVLIHSIRFPASQVCGYRIILDCRGLSWTQLKMCTPANVLLLIHSTQYCFPARYKGIHILSENKLFNLAWSMFYPILTSKLKRRIMLHGSNLTPLLEYIHPSVLPCEYGGEAHPFDNNIFMDVIDENTQIILEQLNYGYKN